MSFIEFNYWNIYISVLFVLYNWRGSAIISSYKCLKTDVWSSYLYLHVIVLLAPSKAFQLEYCSMQIWTNKLWSYAEGTHTSRVWIWASLLWGCSTNHRAPLTLQSIDLIKKNTSANSIWSEWITSVSVPNNNVHSHLLPLCHKANARQLQSN